MCGKCGVRLWSVVNMSLCCSFVLCGCGCGKNPLCACSNTSHTAATTHNIHGKEIEKIIDTRTDGRRIRSEEQFDINVLMVLEFHIHVPTWIWMLTQANLSEEVFILKCIEIGWHGPLWLWLQCEIWLKEAQSGANWIFRWVWFSYWSVIYVSNARSATAVCLLVHPVSTLSVSLDDFRRRRKRNWSMADANA